MLGRLLGRLRVERAGFVGISMGGAVALRYALDHPETVTDLALVDSHGLGGATDWLPGASLLVRNPVANGFLWGWLRSGRTAVRQALGRVMHPANVTDEVVADVHRTVQGAGPRRATATWQRAEFGFGGFRTDLTADLPALGA